MQYLFAQVDRTDSSPSNYMESRFCFLNRVSGFYWEQVRQLLESWYGHLPKSDRSDIRGRLRSDDDNQHRSAFWELYLHELFRRSGYEVEFHPHSPDSSARPDYLVRHGDQTIYVEALVVHDDQELTREERLRSQFIEMLERVRNDDFFLMYHPKREGKSIPPTGKLRRELEAWLTSLNVDEAFSRYQQDSLCLPNRRWRHDDWDVTFYAIPKSPSSRGSSSHRLFGAIAPAGARLVNDAYVIRERLHAKVSKYGKLGIPFLIAVSSNRFTTSGEEFARSLFGPAWEHPRLLRAATQYPGLGHYEDGLWLGQTGIHHTGLSAVLCATGIHPWSVSTSRLQLWHNPWCQLPLDIEIPIASNRVDLTSGTLTHMKPVKPINEVFGLPTLWPEGTHFRC